MMEAKIPVWTVTQLNEAIKDLLENTFLPVCVLGEISGLTIHRSGECCSGRKQPRHQRSTI